MVLRHMPLQNLDVVALANLPHQLPHLPRHVPTKHRLAVLRGEDEVVVQ